MKDKKRMLMPETSLETGTMESWLEEMFAKGWQLEECGFRFARFRRTEPTQVRCRLMPMPKNESLDIRREREELFNEMGWEYLTNKVDQYDIYICRAPHAPELETDPVAAAWARDRMLRKERRNLILAWLALAAVIMLVISRIVRSETPVETLIRSVGISAPLSMLMLVWAVWETAAFLRRVRFLRRQMDAGLPRSRAGSWRGERRRVGLILGATILMDILVIGYPLSQLGASWGADLEELDRPVPCLMGWQVDEILTEADRTSGVCLMNPTFLNPGHYDVWDYYPGERKLINQGDVLLLSFLAEPLYREWQERIRDYAEGNVIELDDPGFDGVFLGRRGEDTFLVLWQGRVVLYVGACGVTGVEKHLDEYADVLAQFQ